MAKFPLDKKPKPGEMQVFEAEGIPDTIDLFAGLMEPGKLYPTWHFLYFPSQELAQTAFDEMVRLDRVTRIMPSIPPQWLVQVLDLMTPETSIGPAAAEMEEFCQRFGGTYDFWETEIAPPAGGW